MYLIRPPFLLRWAFPKALFSVPTAGAKEAYLTFDDGPEPGVTDHVLDILAAHGAPATFFLLGKNAEKHPALVDRIRTEGHTVANHGFDHLNGWRTPTGDYVLNWERAVPILGDRLFRPPYGRITPAQYRALHPRTTICMWDIISGDFDASLTPDACERNVTGHLAPGSIIVMHDSRKARVNVCTSLNPIIRTMKGMGYTLKKL